MGRKALFQSPTSAAERPDAPNRYVALLEKTNLISQSGLEHCLLDPSSRQSLDALGEGTSTTNREEPYLKPLGYIFLRAVSRG
jgi:hypothetical protein